MISFKEGAIPCGSEVTQLDWGNSYLDPYSQQGTYWNWLCDSGHRTVNLKSFHYGADAHRAWANHLTNIIKESIMVT